MPEAIAAPAPAATPAPATDTATNAAVSAGVDAKDGAIPQVAAEKLYRVKIDGKDRDIGEAELLRGYSHSSAANARMMQAAETQKQYQTMMTRLQTDPFELLQDPKIKLSKPMREMAEQYLLSQIEEDSLDPRDRELRDTKKQLQERDSRDAQAEKEAEEAKSTKLREQYSKSYAEDITAALETSGLPRTEITVKRTAFYLAQAVKQGLDLKATDVVKLVREDFMTEQKELLSGLSAAELVRMYPELSTKIRKFELEKHKAGNKNLARPRAEGAKPVAVKDQRVSKDEWRAKLDRIKKGQ